MTIISVFLLFLKALGVHSYKGLVAVDKQWELPYSQSLYMQAEAFVTVSFSFDFSYFYNPSNIFLIVLASDNSPYYQLTFQRPQTDGATDFTIDVVIAGESRQGIIIKPTDKSYNDRFVVYSKLTNGGPSAVGGVIFKGELLIEFDIESSEGKNTFLKKSDSYSRDFSVVNGRFGIPGHAFHNGSELYYGAEQWVTTVCNTDGFSQDAEQRYFAVDVGTKEIAQTFSAKIISPSNLGFFTDYLQMLKPFSSVVSQFKIGGLNNGSVEEVWFITLTKDESRYRLIANNRMKIMGIPKKECKLNVVYTSKIFVLAFRYDVIATIMPSCLTKAELVVDIYFDKTLTCYAHDSLRKPLDSIVSKPGHVHFKFLNINLGSQNMHVVLRFYVREKMPKNITFLQEITHRSYDGEKFANNRTRENVQLPVYPEFRQPIYNDRENSAKNEHKSSTTFVCWEKYIAFCHYKSYMRFKFPCGLINGTTNKIIFLPKTWTELVGLTSNNALIGKDENSQFYQWQNGKSSRLSIEKPTIRTSPTLITTYNDVRKNDHFRVKLLRIDDNQNLKLIDFRAVY